MAETHQTGATQRSQKTIKADLCIIGAGSGGLVVAAVAAPLGVKTVLIEQGEMGGDCLNYGCVPSKSLLAAAKMAHLPSKSGPFGILPSRPEVDFGLVQDHVDRVIAEIAPHDSQERFEALGCTVLRETARFVERTMVEAGDTRVIAKRFVLATGSRPKVPPVEGLEAIPYLTNETIFDLTVRPRHLLILGGGPIGLEMAQAHRRLGCDVTVVDSGRPLSKEDPALAERLVAALEDEGVRFVRSARARSVQGGPGDLSLRVQHADSQYETLHGSHLLVAVGRAPTVTGLGLDIAGVDHDASGIATDRRLRTSNKRILAVGDCRGGPQFTHAAAQDASIVIRNALFRMPAKTRDDRMPRVTYTDPELAHIGLTEAAAKQRYGRKLKTVSLPFADNDRARADRATDGCLKVMAGPGGKILGVSILGHQAGELLAPWCLAMTKGLTLKSLTETVLPYPTMNEISKRAASEYYRDSLFSAKTRALVRILQTLS